MKRFIIILSALALALAVFAGITLGAAAETPIPSSKETETASPPPSASDEPLPADPAGSEEGGFGVILSRIWENYASEIFSVLTLVTSLVLAYFYKRGLVPVVWSGIDRIGRASEEAGSAARTIAAATDTRLTEFISRVEPVLTGVEAAATQSLSLAEYIRHMEQSLADSETERERVRLVMAGVADLLFDVFSAANLPAYAKERLGTRYNALSAILNEEVNDTDEQKTADL